MGILGALLTKMENESRVAFFPFPATPHAVSCDPFSLVRIVSGTQPASTRRKKVLGSCNAEV